LEGHGSGPSRGGKPRFPERGADRMQRDPRLVVVPVQPVTPLSIKWAMTGRHQTAS
jgi:hypothetical protein